MWSKNMCKYRGLVGMGSMGSAEPINFQRWSYKPINSLEISLKYHYLGGDIQSKTDIFFYQDVPNPSIKKHSGTPGLGINLKLFYRGSSGLLN